MTRKKPRTLPPRDARGATAVVQTTGRAPKLPHEIDESTQGMRDDGLRDGIRQAHDDVEAGRSDTSRGEATDAAYRKLKR